MSPRSPAALRSFSTELCEAQPTRYCPSRCQINKVVIHEQAALTMCSATSSERPVGVEALGAVSQTLRLSEGKVPQRRKYLLTNVDSSTHNSSIVKITVL